MGTDRATRLLLVSWAMLGASCSRDSRLRSTDDAAPIVSLPDAAPPASDADADAGAAHPDDADRTPDATPSAVDASANDAAPPCTTRVTYGAAWIRPPNHPDAFDLVVGSVAWDGVCTDEGPNSYAVLSNGWKPYFTGHGGCTIAIDDGCAVPTPACATRVHYGSAWLRAPAHPADDDVVSGRLTWDGTCLASGGNSYAVLSNGWTPYFSGPDACELAFEYTGCGGLYANPVVSEDCPDPGVLRDGNRFVMACTSGNAPNAFPIRVSSDLATWTKVGFVFAAGHRPTWATGDFWAPEIHQVEGRFVAYFTARNADGRLSVGAASADGALGPFTDLGAPLVHDPSIGLIDPSEFEAPDGTRYLLWKEDGNAMGVPTPIRAQLLAPDGLSLVGRAVTLITNDQPWEGPLVEGPWMLVHDGAYYLFYSGNAFYNATYAVGVARADAPLGPFTKAPAPILSTDGAWVGPGHCSVLDLPDGETVMIYHAWQAGHVNGPGDGRLPLVDRIVWQGGWPSVPDAPSSRSVPLP
jgi:GH43 family beta-xylosidase